MLAGWGEGVVPYDLDAARAQAARCVDCGVPGCRNACPLANRIPDWLQAVARGDTAGAAAILAETSALPEVCGTLCPQHRLCEGACTRDGEGEGLKNGAVTIGALERWLGAAALDLPPPAQVAPSGRSVAVIGAGPAGLACADRLVRAGVAVTVYDRNATAGGLLASGVPPFKLDKTLLARRIARLQEMGVRFELGVTVEAEHFGQLLDAHDAVFLGTGAQRSRPASLPGRDLPGVLDALDFLAAVNAGTAPSLLGKRVLVLGGGDSAMDCARSVRRLGAAVAVATRGDFRASPKEIEAAREEGVELLAQHVPQSLLGSEAVEGVRFDSPGTSRDLPADRVILALGQVPAPPAWLAAHGVMLDESGRIVVDGQGRTTHPKLYAGGDNTRGPDLVVTAMADGRRAAEGMLDAFSLRGRIQEQARHWLPTPRGEGGAGGGRGGCRMKSLSPLVLMLFAAPAFAGHPWGGVDICEARKDIVPPGIDPALLPEPAFTGRAGVAAHLHPVPQPARPRPPHPRGVADGAHAHGNPDESVALLPRPARAGGDAGRGRAGGAACLP